MSGQIAGLVNKEQRSKEIITEMFEEAEKIMENLKFIAGGSNE
jgi:enoyl-[acyl-carrier protein] reductase II